MSSGVPLSTVDLEGATTRTPRGTHAVLTKDELDRLKTRVDAFGTYAVISTLSVNLGMRLFTSINAATLQGYPVLVARLLCALTTMCVLSGVYAAVIFTLISVYTKTAIGSMQDDRAVDFFRTTSKYRQRGFKAYCSALACFVLSFLIMIPKFMGYTAPAGFAFLIGIALVTRGTRDFKEIYTAAQHDIYHQ